MSLGMSRGAAPVPPDKGSFPLDRKGQCKEDVKAFLDCIREHNAQHGKCRKLSKKYLACRMQRGLMREESFDVLGYKQVDNFEYRTAKDQVTSSSDCLRLGLSAGSIMHDAVFFVVCGPEK